MKMNIWNGKHFDGRELIYTFHVIEYQYPGFPHAHLVVRLDDAHDSNIWKDLKCVVVVVVRRRRPSSSSSVRTY